MQPSAHVKTSALQTINLTGLNHPCPCAPLPTLSPTPRDVEPTARGESGGLLLSLDRTLTEYPLPVSLAHYIRFSRVRLQASGTRKFGAVPSAGSATVKTDPVILVATSRVYTALRPRSDPPSASVSVHRRKEGPLGHLRPEVLAQDGLCCPACQRLIDLIRQSGELRTLSRFPVMGAVLDIQASMSQVKP